ncbi:hypothetical protein J2W42_005807 [Rhizobium tibeticum]|nr:hypothetical protein [Rhizobium tibeticum]
MVKIEEQALVEWLVAQPTVEGLNIAVLHLIFRSDLFERFCDGARPGKAMPEPSPQAASTLCKMKASRFRQLHAAPHGVFKTAGALVAAGPKIRAVFVMPTTLFEVSLVSCRQGRIR